MTDDLTKPAQSGGDPDGEPGELIHDELVRFAHDPRAELLRLKEEEEAGETGATPFILIAALAPLLLGFVSAVALAMLTVYFLAR